MIAQIILFIVFVLSTYFIIKPFLTAKGTGQPVPVDDTDAKIHDLEKISLLKQIREVEFEKEMGITSDEDFQRIRSELIDKVGSYLEPVNPDKNDSGKKSPKSPRKCPQCGNPVKYKDKFCGTCGHGLHQPTCNQCGAAVAKGAKFCQECGKSLH